MDVSSKKVFEWTLWFLIAGVLLRLAGWVGNFAVVVGFLGSLIVMALLQLLPHPKIKKWATVAALGWIILFVGWPALKRSFLADKPMLRDAYERSKKEGELTAAEWMRPEAILARIGLKRYCEELEQLSAERLAERFSQEADSVRRSGTTGVVLLDLERYRAAVDTIFAHREKCRQLILTHDAKDSAEASATTSQEPRWPSVRELIPELGYIAEHNPVPWWLYILLAVILISGMSRGVKHPTLRAVAVVATSVLLIAGFSALYTGRQELVATTQPQRQTRPQPRSAPQAQTVRREVASGTLVTMTGQTGPDCTGIQVPPRAFAEVSYSGGDIQWFGLPVTVGADYIGWPTWANQNVPAGERMAYALERCHYRNTCVIFKYEDGREDVVVDFEPSKRILRLRNLEPTPAQVCLDINIKQSYLADRTGELRHDGRSWLTGAMQFRVRII